MIIEEEGSAMYDTRVVHSLNIEHEINGSGRGHGEKYRNGDLGVFGTGGGCLKGNGFGFGFSPGQGEESCYGSGFGGADGEGFSNGDSF